MEMQFGRSLDTAVCCRTLNMHTNLHTESHTNYYCVSWCEYRGNFSAEPGGVLQVGRSVQARVSERLRPRRTGAERVS